MSTQILLTARDESSQLREYANQYFNLTGYDGSQVTISLEDIREWRYYSGITYIVDGTAIGLCSVLLSVLIALAVIDRSRLRRPIFIFNMMSLFLVFVRAVISAVLTAGPFGGFAQVFLGAPIRYGYLEAVLSILCWIAQIFLYTSITATLGLQVRAAFSGTKRGRLFIKIALSLAAVVLLAFEITYGVFYCQAVVQNTPTPNWVLTTVRVLFVIYVGSCSLAFIYKLAIAIRQRRRIGITKFGPLQILFIMSCQCLMCLVSSLCPQN